MLPFRPRPGGARPPTRGLPPTLLKLLLLLLTLAATATAAFLFPAPPARGAAAARGHTAATAARSRSLQPLHGRRALPRGLRTALRAAAAAPGEVDAKALEAWAGKWKQDNAQDGQPAPEATVFPHVALAEVLAEVFTQVLEAEKAEGEKKGQQRLLLFPEAKALYDAGVMERLIDHLDLCKEVCEVLGESQNAVAMHPSAAGAYNSPVPAILVKALPTQNMGFSDDDPYWDDDEDDSGFGAWPDYGEDDAEAQEYEKLYAVPEEDGPIMEGMKAWVDAIIADLGVCPFTVSAAKAGLPMGSIRYYIDRAASPEAIYARYWNEVALISSDGRNAQNEKALSTTLLITPNFGLRNREYFETFSNTLTQPLEALALEEEVQLVFFHPEWVFRDGADRMGRDDAANYARRSPWPMINILRTPQVRKAQKAIPTGLVYRQNEVTLDKIGSWRLQRWLVSRDWSEVKDSFRVDRKTVPILATAQDLLQGLSPQSLSDADPNDVVVAPPLLEGLAADPEEVVEKLHVKHAREAEEEEAAGPEAWGVASGRGGEDDGWGGDDDDDDWEAGGPVHHESGARVQRQQEEGEGEGGGEDGEARVLRPRDEIVEDCKGVVNVLRKRLGQNAALTPAEIQEFEERAARLRKDK